jgi:hypothetical protein
MAAENQRVMAARRRKQNRAEEEESVTGIRRKRHQEKLCRNSEISKAKMKEERKKKKEAEAWRSKKAGAEEATGETRHRKPIKALIEMKYQ